MADDQLLGGGGDDVFVYTGGEQEVPRDVRRVKIDESVDTILARAFRGCRQLTEVEGHDKLKKIKEGAFFHCYSLRRVTKMNGVIEIEAFAFLSCIALRDLEFDKLEIVGLQGFGRCESLTSINLPLVRRIEQLAFPGCIQLMDAVFGEDLGIIGRRAIRCTALRRIVIPLKRGLIVENTFVDCDNLSRVDVIGGIHKAISLLHMETWRTEMKEEIDEINQILPDTPTDEKTPTIQRWIETVLDRMEHYKAEHLMLVKEAMTLLELALWKAKLDEENGSATRKDNRVTCGASIVIKNMLPFLVLK